MRGRFTIHFICLALAGCAAAGSQERPGHVLTPPAVRQAESLYPVTFEGRYGFMDRTGKLAISLPPEVYNTRHFSEGMAVIGVRVPNTHGRWGYVDETGRVVIQPQFRRAEPFSEGLAAVVIGDNEDTIGRLGYIDKSGAVVIRPQFSGSSGGDHLFAQGLAAVETQAGKWGYIDKTGAMAIRPQFDAAFGFSEGLAVVGVNVTTYSLEKRYGYVDRGGNWVVRPRFTDAGGFSEGLAAVTEGGRVGYINRKGETVIKPQFDEGNSCGEGRWYERARYFSEGLGAVRVAGKWGYIDRTGRVVIEPRYDCAQRFSEGLAVVGSRTGPFTRMGYIDKAGTPVIQFQFTEAGAFSGGLAPVGVGPDDQSLEKALREAEKDKSERAVEKLLELEGEVRHGYIDKSGKYVWTPTRGLP